ncbi:MAG: hypothetical protein NUW12_11495 [Firmicutes bacterium]|jgi:hypothetical protein|nr:hypothetical protein [Bacillota bacterium]MDH7495329.1 hypothetical protein [Bacillota bacterium]
MVVDARQLRVLKAEIQSDLRAIRCLDEAVEEARPADLDVDLDVEPSKVVRSSLRLDVRRGLWGR